MKQFLVESDEEGNGDEIVFSPSKSPNSKFLQMKNSQNEKEKKKAFVIEDSSSLEEEREEKRVKTNKVLKVEAEKEESKRKQKREREEKKFVGNFKSREKRVENEDYELQEFKMENSEDEFLNYSVFSSSNKRGSDTSRKEKEKERNLDEATKNLLSNSSEGSSEIIPFKKQQKPSLLSQRNESKKVENKTNETQFSNEIVERKRRKVEVREYTDFEESNWKQHFKGKPSSTNKSPNKTLRKPSHPSYSSSSTLKGNDKEDMEDMEGRSRYGVIDVDEIVVVDGVIDKIEEEEVKKVEKGESKVVCKYGANCYRKSSEHKLKYFHPSHLSLPSQSYQIHKEKVLKKKSGEKGEKVEKEEVEKKKKSITAHSFILSTNRTSFFSSTPSLSFSSQSPSNNDKAENDRNDNNKNKNSNSSGFQLKKLILEKVPSSNSKQKNKKILSGKKRKVEGKNSMNSNNNNSENNNNSKNNTNSKNNDNRSKVGVEKGGGEKLWSEKYCPRNVLELAVNGTKIKEIREWFAKAFSLNPPPSSSTSGFGGGFKKKKMLCLTGPAGCAKTVTVKLLAEELGVEVLEYFNSTVCSWKSSELEFVPGKTSSQMEQFKQFLFQARKAPSLFSLQLTGAGEIKNSKNDNSNIASTERRKLVLIEDLPPLLDNSSILAFRESIKLFVTNSCFPLVLILTDTQEGTNEMNNFLSEIVHQPFFTQIKYPSSLLSFSSLLLFTLFFSPSLYSFFLPFTLLFFPLTLLFL